MASLGHLTNNNLFDAFAESQCLIPFKEVNAWVRGAKVGDTRSNQCANNNDVV